MEEMAAADFIIDTLINPAPLTPLSPQTTGLWLDLLTDRSLTPYGRYWYSMIYAALESQTDYSLTPFGQYLYDMVDMAWEESQTNDMSTLTSYGRTDWYGMIDTTLSAHYLSIK